MGDVFFMLLMVALCVASVIFGYRFGYKECSEKMTPPEFKLRKIALNDGDVVVLSTEKEISDEAAKRLKAICESKFEGHQVLVFGGGMKLDVLGPDST